ncbi:lysoplasmalogenase [Streptomyces sp. MBT65]|uniref:lysoplasmalogenase n=1 Tax=Streptomyces sp. MBT65 TaxID=1488395 RepID=UPI00190D1652|nr:lysoplasmalogenase [Streptomyces sp. MBT65]MBK3578081.1 lysoplasmalogenase [Streptomyces sp. MBT65]
MRVSRALSGAFVLATVLDLVFLVVGFRAGHLVAKPLIVPLLAASAARAGSPRLLVAALLCGWGGDVLLLSDSDPAFMAGMASFAVGHVCYLVLFRRQGPPRARAGLLAVGYAVALVTLVVLLWPDLPAGLRVPVAGYSTLLTAMAYTAATRLGPVAGLGGALFMLSDTLIATGVADWPQPPGPDFWIMLTYVAAQFLLVQGVLGTLAERRAPAAAAAYREVRSTTP